VSLDAGRRLCPACGAADAIAADGPLWPASWRCPACGAGLDAVGGRVRLAPDLDEVDDGFALDSFAQLAAIEDGHFWFTTRNALIAWLVRRHAPDARRALEIGCGTGFTLRALRQALPKATITASELHSRGLTHARERHPAGVEFLQMDARQVRLDSALDLVGAFDVLEHIADDRAVIGQIHKALKPGGILVASVPQHPWLWSAADDIAHHQRRYRRGELATKLADAGLSVLYRTSFAALTLPLLAVARLRARKAMIEAEARPPRLVNAALTTVFNVEHTLRRAGLPLPVGGSQILVARK
jgi:SAM-dependent methyltransferase